MLEESWAVRCALAGGPQSIHVKSAAALGPFKECLQVRMQTSKEIWRAISWGLLPPHLPFIFQWEFWVTVSESTRGSWWSQACSHMQPQCCWRGLTTCPSAIGGCSAEGGGWEQDWRVPILLHQNLLLHQQWCFCYSDLIQMLLNQQEVLSKPCIRGDGLTDRCKLHCASPEYSFLSFFFFFCKVRVSPLSNLRFRLCPADPFAFCFPLALLMLVPVGFCFWVCSREWQ